MSFSSGTFSLVAGNPVVTGTTISSTVQNNTLSDIATGLSTCILKDGTQVATAPIPFYAGTVGLPGVYLGTDTTSGVYRIGANNIGVAISAAKVLDIAASGLSVTGLITGSTSIALSPIADPSTPNRLWSNAGVLTWTDNLGANHALY